MRFTFNVPHWSATVVLCVMWWIFVLSNMYIFTPFWASRVHSEPQLMLLCYTYVRKSHLNDLYSYRITYIACTYNLKLTEHSYLRGNCNIPFVTKFTLAVIKIIERTLFLARVYCQRMLSTSRPFCLSATCIDVSAHGLQ